MREEMVSLYEGGLMIDNDQVVLDAVKYKLDSDDFDTKRFKNLNSQDYKKWSRWLLTDKASAL